MEIWFQIYLASICWFLYKSSSINFEVVPCTYLPSFRYLLHSLYNFILQYICKKPCVKRRLGCTMDHKCQKKCHEQCDPCTEMVNKKLPCDHSRKIKCNKNTKDVKCLKLCKQLLKCGHPCKLKCFEPCSTICHQLVSTTLKDFNKQF